MSAVAMKFGAHYLPTYVPDLDGRLPNTIKKCSPKWRRWISSATTISGSPNIISLITGATCRTLPHSCRRLPAQPNRSGSA